MLYVCKIVSFVSTHNTIIQLIVLRIFCYFKNYNIARVRIIIGHIASGIYCAHFMCLILYKRSLYI